MSPNGFAANTPVSAPNAPLSPPMNPTSFGTSVKIVPTDVISFPTIKSTGPNTATISPIFTISCCWAGDRALNLSTSIWM